MSTKTLVAAMLGAAALSTSMPALANPAAGHGPTDAQGIEPGNVGPGSEKNSQVSPTSPAIPIDKQPPPEISLPANSSSGSSAGDKGSGPEGTSPPHNPSSPGLQ
jgi:hypothetical protein